MGRYTWALVRAMVQRQHIQHQLSYLAKILGQTVTNYNPTELTVHSMRKVPAQQLADRHEVALAAARAHSTIHFRKLAGDCGDAGSNKRVEFELFFVRFAVVLDHDESIGAAPCVSSMSIRRRSTLNAPSTRLIWEMWVQTRQMRHLYKGPWETTLLLVFVLRSTWKRRNANTTG